MAERFLYPLRFQPLYKSYLWGGRRLAALLGKQLPPDGPWAECWEIADLGSEQTCVASGHLQGIALNEVLARYGRELLGRHYPRPRFPLLLKFLDALQSLSVQVHPSDALAARLVPPAAGKTEAWVVLAAEPRSIIYAGLKSGVDRETLAEAVQRGACQECLHSFEPAVGDCVFLPAGTVHALGAGLVVAEIQQPSDITYRLFDWNRLGPNGRPRQLHVAEALEAIDYERGPVRPCKPQPGNLPHVSRLVECPYFCIERCDFDRPYSLGGDERFHIVVVLEGEIVVAADTAPVVLERGGVVLLPASLGRVFLEPLGGASVLDVYLP